MMTAFRVQLRAAMAELPTRRPPALRRSDREEWLFATDFPQTADGEVTAVLTEKLLLKGWRVCEQNGWLLIDPVYPVPALPDDWQERVSSLAGETAAAIAVLCRHKAMPEPDLCWIRRILKAGEQGKAAMEKSCAQLHHELAVCLREHRAMPGLVLEYLVLSALSQLDQSDDGT